MPNDGYDPGPTAGPVKSVFGLTVKGVLLDADGDRLLVENALVIQHGKAVMDVNVVARAIREHQEERYQRQVTPGARVRVTERQSTHFGQEYVVLDPSDPEVAQAKRRGALHWDLYLLLDGAAAGFNRDEVEVL